MTANSGFPSLANPIERPDNGRMLAASAWACQNPQVATDAGWHRLPSRECRLRMALVVALLLAAACAGSTVGHAETTESDGIVGAPEENCAKPLVERASDQTIVTIACDRKDGREVTSILFTGDFQDWYHAQSKATLTGANDGSIRRSGFTIEARRLRDDCSQPSTR